MKAVVCSAPQEPAWLWPVAVLAILASLFFCALVVKEGIKLHREGIL